MFSMFSIVFVVNIRYGDKQNHNDINIYTYRDQFRMGEGDSNEVYTMFTYIVDIQSKEKFRVRNFLKAHKITKYNIKSFL